MISKPGDEADALRSQLDRLAHIERRYRELLLGDPRHPEGDALSALVDDGDFGVAWVAMPHEDGALQISSSAGALTGVLDDLVVRPGEGLTGKVFNNGEISWVDEYFRAPTITHDFDRQIRSEQVTRLIAVPLIDNGTVVGVVAAGSRTGGLFGGVAVDQVVATASGMALSAIIAARERRMAELVALEERRRIAMDLHDSVGAMLYSIGAEARGIREGSTGPSAADERLDRISNQTAEAAVLLRRALRALHASPGELALESALQGDCRAFEQRSGVTTHVVVLNSPPTMSDATVALAIRSLREALHNVEKHASASTVAVSVSSDDGFLTLVVADDGVGIDSRGGEAGLGLNAMAETVERAGGSLDIRPGSDGGTTLRLRLPV